MANGGRGVLTVTETSGFLGVSQSLTGRRWVGPGIEVERAAEAIEQATALPRAVCQVLARRGVPVAEATGFLTPQLRDLLPDPRRLRDMEKAAARFLQAVQRRERIAVFADYDVDGGSSAALLLVWLRDMGLEATLYIPDRIDEGYGPNDEAMAMLAAAHDLIVCVDCGTLSHGPIAAAKGADVRSNPGISVKLSALHPRYEVAKTPRVMAELVPVLTDLCRQAAAAGIGLNIDAEEADRLADRILRLQGSPARLAGAA